MPRLKDFGLNLKPVHCPECAKKMPFLRMPTSVRQLMWGGWTCSSCSCEIDKWGERISPQVSKSTT